MSNDINLFLDVDGVFNGNYQHHNDIFDFDKVHLSDIGLNQNRGDYISEYKFSVFRNLTKKYNVKIVGVSSVFSGHKNEVKQYAKILDINLVDFGYTTGGGKERGEQVLKYVKDHNIKNFVIVDDSGDRFYSPTDFAQYKKHCIFPCGRFGLTDYHFECLEVIFKNMQNGTNEIPYTYTTKMCYNCGSHRMIAFRSLNYKECAECQTQVKWNLADDQKPLL